MIVKRLYLNMENWSVSRGSYQLGYIAENQVTLLQIATEIDPNCTYHLEQKINDESYILYLEKGDGVLTATIPNTMLTSKGNANWQIVGIYSDESVKKSNIFSVYISDSINAENEVPASEITAFTEALADLAGNMSEVAAYAESASASASEARESAESASASAESASASASEASTHASNASASATTATEQASLASSSATSAQTYAGNASTSEQSCATYASNARVSAEKAQEYVESLDNWTTVEFTLANFTYDKNSGITYLRTEAPSGYEIAEIKGYFTVSKRESDSSTTTTVIDMTTPEYSSEMDGTLCSASHSTSTKGFSAVLSADINVDLLYCQSALVYATSSTSFSPISSPTLTNSAARGKMLNQSKFETTSFTLKTNVPNSNLLYFFGKLQYRVVPSA